jgi:hypothetical protein
MTSVPLRKLVTWITDADDGFAYHPRFHTQADPVFLIGSPSLPRPPFAITTVSGAGLSNLLAIAYDSNVLGLGPDYPWDD